MDSESRTVPTASKATTPVVRRVYPATWAVIFLAVAILALIEIPGRRSGATTYVHGWPITYLHRDYVNDPDFVAAMSTTGWSPGATTMPASTGGASKTAMDLWAEDGWPWEVERTLNPWSTANTTEISLADAGLDCLTALLIVLAIAEVFQRWRRRRSGSVFRFRLRTMLIAIVLLSFACAWAVAQRREWQDEQDEIPKLPTASLQASLGSWPGHPYRWVPPVFLPECFLKLGEVGQYFNHITQLDIDDDPASNRGKYASTEELLEPLARLTKLAKLTLSRAAVSDGELKRLSAMSSLSELSIRCDKVIAAGIDQLRKLPRLRSLSVLGLGDEATDRFNDFTRLEKLTLDSRACTRVQLGGLPSLRELTIQSTGNFGQTEPDRLKSVDLASLPVLESLTVGSGAVHLNDLPSLRHVEFWGVRLDATGMQQLRGLPALESLVLYNGASAVGMPFELQGLAKLKSVFAWGAGIENLHLRDLPNLESLELLNNSALREVGVGQLPKLRSIRILGSSLVPALDLRGLDLTSLTITDLEQTIDGGTYVPDRPRTRQLPGLAQQSKLENLSLLWTELDAVTLDGIARMSHLKSLDLTGTWLGDADLPRLKQLKNLTELNLSNTDISDAGLKEIQDLPSLATLWLSSTPVSDAAVRRLRKRHPGLQVFGGGDWKQTATDDLKTQIDETVAGERTAIDVANPDAMGDHDIEKLAGPAGLQTLSLRGTHLTDAETASLVGLHELQSLDLANTHITDAGLAGLSQLSQLDTLSLSKTRIQGIGLRHLKSIDYLQTLDLSESNIADKGLAGLQYVSHLEKLSLSHTAITDEGLADLKYLPELRVLDLRETKVTDAGLRHLRSLSNLEALILSDCDIEGSGLEELRSLPRLRALNLAGNPRLSSAAIEHLARLAHLKTLVLDRSELSTKSLRALAGMKNLRDFCWLVGQPTDEQVDALKRIHFAAKLHLSGVFGRVRSELPDIDFDNYGFAGRDFEVFTPATVRKFERPPANPPADGGGFDGGGFGGGFGSIFAVPQSKTVVGPPLANGGFATMITMVGVPV